MQVQMKTIHGSLCFVPILCESLCLGTTVCGPVSLCLHLPQKINPVIVKMVLIYMWSRFRSIQSQQDVFFGLKAKRLQSAPERAKVSICLELLSPKGDLETWGLWIYIAREHARLLGFCCTKPFAIATKIFWSLRSYTNQWVWNESNWLKIGRCLHRQDIASIILAMQLT